LGNQTLVSGSANSPSVTFNKAGTYYWRAHYNGDGNNTTADSVCTSETVTVGPQTPTVATTMTPANGVITVGGSGSDSATVTGFNPTGSVTFAIYKTSDCSTAALVPGEISAQPLGNQTLVSGSANSPSVTFNKAGTYYWRAHYNGDGNNTAADSVCTSETVTVGPQTPTVATTLSTTAVNIGGTVNDTATVTGFNPTGTVTFKVYDENTCTNEASTGSGGDIDAQPSAPQTLVAGSAQSPTVIFNNAGPYWWRATYNGDGNNVGGVTSVCTDEAMTVNQNHPTMSTTQMLLPDDSATLSGQTANATGSITFKLFHNTDCSGTAAYAQQLDLSQTPYLTHNGVSPNPSVVAQDGTWNWQAIYSGDTNNRSSMSNCGDESFSITNGTNG